KETPAVTSPTDIAPDSRDSTLVAEDFCALLQEDACLPDTDHQNKAASPVYVEEHHGAEVLYCLGESAGELKLHQENTSTEVSALPESQQIKAEAVLLPDVLTDDSFSNGMETQDINTLADVAQRSSAKSVDQKDKDWEKGDPPFTGKVEACLSASENQFIHSVSDPALSISQVGLANSGSSFDIKAVAVLNPENSSGIRNDKETCEIMEFQSSKGNAETKTDAAASVLEADCTLPPSKLDVCFKAEIPCSVLKGDEGSQQTSTPHTFEKLSIGCLASSSLSGLKSNISSNDDSKEYQLSSTASHTKTIRERQSLEENIKTPLKTAAAKPVRFTIAPAWQRSLSGGSNSKEDSYSRSSPTSPVRPELFEGTTKEHTRFDAVIQESEKNNSNRFDRDSKDGDLHLSSSMDWADHEAQNVESPFGVRLRRTSSLLKYQSESRAEVPKLIPSAAPTVSSVSVHEDQKLVGPGKPSPGLPVSTKLFVKRSDLLEDKNPPKTKSEEVAKKQNVSSPHLETASSEPAWVSMAKLKQKGFQGHPLAKEHKAEDKALTKVDREEVEYRLMLHGCKVGPIAQEASVIPAIGKETRHSSNLPMTSCSPAEPPWLSLAKKKAKAWSEMPQIVQ
ncbi:K1210 protein, partial [Dromaius novaehollandiae]|nr:K1210 protein [Dromaius novaehollandiae]